VRTGVSLADTLAGIYAVAGAASALFRRERDRASATVPRADGDTRVRVGMRSPAGRRGTARGDLRLTESLLPDHEVYAERRERLGGRMEGVAPSNAYPCADGSTW